MRVESVIKLKKIKFQNNNIVGVLYYPENINGKWESNTIGFVMKSDEKKFNSLKKLLEKKELFEISALLCKSDKNYYLKITKIELCKNKYKNLGNEEEQEEDNLRLTL